MGKLNLQEVTACPKKLSREPSIPSTAASLSEKAMSFLMKNNKYTKRRTVKEKNTMSGTNVAQHWIVQGTAFFHVGVPLLFQSLTYLFKVQLVPFVSIHLICSVFSMTTFSWTEMLFCTKTTWVSRFWRLFFFCPLRNLSFKNTFSNRKFCDQNSLVERIKNVKVTVFVEGKFPCSYLQMRHFFFEILFLKTYQSKNLICSDFSAWRYDSRFVFQVIFENYYLRQKLNTFCCREQKREDQFLVFCLLTGILSQKYSYHLKNDAVSEHFDMENNVKVRSTAIGIVCVFPFLCGRLLNFWKHFFLGKTLRHVS